jgi:hypothetical protein
MHTMKAYRGSRGTQLHLFLTLALDGSEWSTSHLGHFTPWERTPNTYWRGGWVGPVAGLHIFENIKSHVPVRNQTPDCSASKLMIILTVSETVYRKQTQLSSLPLIFESWFVHYKLRGRILALQCFCCLWHLKRFYKYFKYFWYLPHFFGFTSHIFCAHFFLYELCIIPNLLTCLVIVKS